MTEFKINYYLELKIEGGRTVIYVAGKRFIQCKYLLLNIPVNKIELFKELDSIDAVAEKLDNSLK